MTAEQIIICTAFGRVSFLPGSFNKRLGNGLYAIATSDTGKELSEKQNEWMYRLLYKYRKQIPDVYEMYKDNHLCSQLKRQK